MRHTTRFTAGVLALAALAVADIAGASSHREAPFITKNPKVDGTDFYMFRSYEPGREGFVTVIANYIPLQDAFGGPNYYTMDPEAIYEIHLENTGDAKEDLTFQFKFNDALAGGTGVALDIGGKKVAIPLVNAGPTTATDTSKLNFLETYTVKMIKGDRRTGTAADVTMGATKVFAKPFDNIGKKSFPDYPAYANKYIYDVTLPGCATNAKMFVGQRAEPFAVNLGPVFDLVDAPAAVITDASKRGAVPNPLISKNITSIAMELPISCIKGSTDVIGGWTTASVRQARVLNPSATFAKPSVEGGAWTQISRLGAPLVNEVVIGLKDKDRWNSSVPSDDAQFADYVTNPTLPALIEVLFGPTVKAPSKFPRADLVAAFLTGVDKVNKTAATAEFLRLNVALPATAQGKQNNLGAAACFVMGSLTLTNPGCDPAGFPNGRRPGDDVVDIALRVMEGYLLPMADAPAGQVPFHDAVLQDQAQFDATFPYLRPPTPGANGDGT